MVLRRRGRGGEGGGESGWPDRPGREISRAGREQHACGSDGRRSESKIGAATGTAIGRVFRLSKVLASELRGYEEPAVRTVLAYAEPYLPAAGSLEEMTLSVGKSVFHYHQGCDGVVDIAPFGCMNGIVTEAVYPRVSADCDDMPIRNLFFDGTGTSLEHGLDVIMELARSYQARKKVVRAYRSAHREPAAT